MKRTPLKRAQPLVRRDTGKAEAKVKLPRMRLCEGCRRVKFRPDRDNVTWCSDECGADVALRRVAAEDKRKTRAQLEALKTRSDWIKKARFAVNRYCRLRDIRAGRGCVTCGARPDNRFGGAMDAGHWRSVGSAPQLQFVTSQIRLQCVKCNRYGGGRAVEFRMALVAERGAEWVEAMESANHTAKFSIEYLKRLARVFQKKARRMESRIAMQG